MSSQTSLEARVRIVDYATYDEAQRAVDYLSDRKFPVEQMDIIGYDLRMVERISGRLTPGRAAAAGAGTGAWFGSLLGLLLALFATTTESFFVLLLWGVLLGVVFGAVFGALASVSTGGRRDFTSTSAIVAARYEVGADAAVAEEARELLAIAG